MSLLLKVRVLHWGGEGRHEMLLTHCMAPPSSRRWPMPLCTAGGGCMLTYLQHGAYAPFSAQPLKQVQLLVSKPPLGLGAAVREDARKRAWSLPGTPPLLLAALPARCRHRRRCRQKAAATARARSKAPAATPYPPEACHGPGEEPVAEGGWLVCSGHGCEVCNRTDHG